MHPSLLAAFSLSLIACATPGYDPYVAGSVSVPQDVNVPSSAVLTVTLWEPAMPEPVQLAEVRRPFLGNPAFELELAGGSAILTAWMDLTGDGLSADDLIADELEVSQGDLGLELLLRAQ